MRSGLYYTYRPERLTHCNVMARLGAIGINSMLRAMAPVEPGHDGCELTHPVYPAALTTNFPVFSPLNSIPRAHGAFSSPSTM